MPQNVKITIIEDNLREWELIEESLKKYSVDNYVFYDKALTALAALPYEPAQVIVLDYLLKNDPINGDQVLRDAKTICDDNYFIIVSEELTKQVLIGFIKAHAEDAIEKSEKNYYDKLVEAIILGRQIVRRRTEKAESIKEAQHWLQEKAKSLTQKIENLTQTAENDRTNS